MRQRLLGALVLLALTLAMSGCGSEKGGATEESPSPAASATSPGSGSPSPATYAKVLHATAAGGEVGPPVRLASAAAVTAFTAQFTRPELGTRLRRYLARQDLAPGTVMVGRVVAVGCDIPRVHVVGKDGALLEPEPVKATTKECFAAMTSVAIAAVPEASAP